MSARGILILAVLSIYSSGYSMTGSDTLKSWSAEKNAAQLKMRNAFGDTLKAWYRKLPEASRKNLAIIFKKIDADSLKVDDLKKIFANDAQFGPLLIKLMQDYKSVPDELNCPCAEKDAANFKNYDYAEAFQYAPVFLFADQEEYLPVMPFFSAFDGYNNNDALKNQTSPIDMHDAVEIAPEISNGKSEKHVSWDSLKSWYNKFPEKKNLVTIFYNIASIKPRDLQKILHSDEHFYRRLDQGTKDYLEKENNGDSIKVYQYYFYCIQDSGLQGHPEDLERSFIFVAPNDSFFVAVGVGHSDFVPNNVLFYKKKNLVSGRLHVLVELGGHSNAPDIDGDGIFEPGIDSNWHIENLWGTRDVQAVSGLGAVGKYASWMNFARKRENDDSNTFYPPDNKIKNRWSNYCYRLLPVQLFHELLDSIETHAKQFSDYPGKPNSENEMTNSLTKLIADSTELASEIHRLQKAFKNETNLTRKENRQFQADLDRIYDFFFQLQKKEDELRIMRKADDLSKKRNKDETNLHEAINSRFAKLSYNPIPISIQIKRLDNPLNHVSAWNSGLLVHSRTPSLRFLNGLTLGTHLETERPRFKDLDFMYPEWRVGVLLRPQGKRSWPKLLDGVWEIHTGFMNARFHSRPKFQKRSLTIYYDNYYAKSVSYYLNWSLRTQNWDRYAHMWGAGFSFTIPYYPVLKPENVFRNFRLRLGFGFESHKFSRDRFFPLLEFGIHTRHIPTSNREYVIESTKHHKMWEQKDFDAPKQVFKKQLFRPRRWPNLVVWSSYADWQKYWPAELRLGLIIPAWDAVPVKLDGILEFQAGWVNQPAGAMIGLYYDRFYAARLPSWYLSVNWTDTWGRDSSYSFGGGFSVGIPIGSKHPSLFRARLGLRTDFAYETKAYQLTRYRLEFQFGLQL